MKRCNKSKVRSASGQLEVFAGELIVAAIVLVGFLYFLVNTGTATYYKEKLGFVSQQGALFAANYDGKKVEAATTQFVTELCKQTGLKISNLKVSVGKSEIADRAAFTCQVSGVFPLPYFQEGVFPSAVASSDTAAAISMKPASGGGGPMLNILGIGNLVLNNAGIIPTGNVLGIGNVYTNQTKIGNTIGIGNINSTGNTLGIGNINSTGNTLGIGNINNSGNALGIGNINNDGNALGIGNINNDGNALGIGHLNNDGNAFGLGP